MVVCKKSSKVICTNFSHGKCHDFALYKQSRFNVHPDTELLADSGYQGLEKEHANSRMPTKRRRGKTLSKEERSQNKKLASERVLNENVIGKIKRFKIVCDRYRNRRKRFGLRFNLIAGIYNYELKN